MENVRLGMGGKGIVGLEKAMRSIAARMDHALGYTLMIEMENLLPEVEVIDDKRPARTDTQRILIVRHRPALGRREHRLVAFGDLMKFSAIPSDQHLVVNCRIGTC